LFFKIRHDLRVKCNLVAKGILFVPAAGTGLVDFLRNVIAEMEKIVEVKLVLDPLMVLSHILFYRCKLFVGIDVAQDRNGDEGDEEEGEGYFEDGDLIVVDVGIDG